jgi:general secretion pathway protein H
MTPISARGSDGARAACPRRRMHARGFTLIELLVVMVIVGIVMAVATLAPTRNRATDLRDEAQRLAALLETAADQAQVRSIPIAWQPVNGGYVFTEARADGSWRALDDSVLKPVRWRADVTGVAIRYSGSAQTLRRVIFGEESIGAPVVIGLSAGASRFDVVGDGIGGFLVRQP